MAKNVDEFARKTQNKTNYILEDTLLDSEVLIDDVKKYNYDEIVKNSPKAIMSKLPWLFTLFLIIIVAVLIGASFLNSNPQTYFTNTIDKFFSSITDNISDNNYDISKGKIKASFDISSLENKELFDEISKLEFDMDYMLDSSSDLLHLFLNTNYEDEDLIDLDIYSDKDNFYFYSDGIYDKYIKIKNNSKFKVISSSDIKFLLNGINQSFDKVVTSEKIYGKRTELDLGTKTINVFESKLIINSKNYKRVSETFINGLKSNNEFISSLAKITGKSSGNIKKSLVNFLPKIKAFFRDNNGLEIKLYNDRKTKNFIKSEISGKNISFILLKEENKVIFNLKKAGKFISGDIAINVNKSKNNYNFVFKILNGESDKMENSVSGNVSFTINKANSFKRIKIDDAVSIDDLTELEKLGIYAKLFSNPNLSKFLK